MAFCTGCGARIEDTAKFCPACGTRVPEAVATGAQTPAGGTSPSTAGTAASTAATRTPALAAAPAGAVQPVPAPGGGASAVKVIIIIAVIVVGLALLAFAGVFWAGYKLKKAIRVEQRGENATVSTPWGKVTSNEDSAKVAREMGFEVYPGARPLPGASAVAFGGSTVGSAEFETDDAIEKVGKFYSSRYPKSTVNTADENQQTIMASTDRGMVTIVLEKQGNGTKISLSRIGGKGEPQRGDESQ